MTDNDKNEKILKLNIPTSLDVSKTSDTTEMKHSFGKGKSRTITVEVKKTRTISRDKNISSEPQRGSEDEDQKGSLTESEKQTRIKAIKTAAKTIDDNILKARLEEERKKSSVEKNPLEVEKKEAAVEELIPNSEEKVSLEVGDKAIEILTEKKVVLPEKIVESNLEEEGEFDIKSKKSLKPDKKTLSPKSNKDDKWLASKHIILTSLEESEDQIEEKKFGSGSFTKRRYKNKRQDAGEKRDKIAREVIVPDFITVQELALRMSEKSINVTRELSKLGITASFNEKIDADIATIVAMEMGHKPKRVSENDIEKNFQENVNLADDKKLYKTRGPVVTIMGHVDHGKTSLLDAFRSSSVVDSESGGITQHIGAYKITTKNGREITFLDTPGHEAFSAIRSRGAKCTDIVILVVAADDGIMPQTIEAINHAKAADVAIIVAINKIDRPGVNLEKVKNGLLAHNIFIEEYGGEIMSVEISAKQKINLDKLEEAILVQADMLQLTSNVDRPGAGTVIESKLDKNKGVINSFLVQNGTLKLGDFVVAGKVGGKVRSMIDDRGNSLKEASASTPVEIYGLNEIVEAGTSFVVAENERKARDIIEHRAKKEKMEKMEKNSSIRKETISSMLTNKNKVKELNLIIKADAHGSLEALVQSLNKYCNNEVKVRILHDAIGAITESDVNLAMATKSVIMGFNVRAETKAKILSEKNDLRISYYSIIYNLLDDVKLLLTGMLTPIVREIYLGNAEIRQVFDITKVGKIAGSYVTKGIIKRGAFVRLLRDNIVIHEGKLKSLKRMKDEVKEVRENYECGIAFENYEDLKEKDVLEVFEFVEEKKEFKI